MLVHVLLFDAGQDSEGIPPWSFQVTPWYSCSKTATMLSVTGLLEAQDSPPSVEALDREVELFCREAGYEARLVSAGLFPNPRRIA